MPNNITTFGQTPYVDDFQTSPVAGGKTPEEKKKRPNKERKRLGNGSSRKENRS